MPLRKIVENFFYGSSFLHRLSNNHQYLEVHPLVFHLEFEDLLPLFEIKRAASKSGSRDLKPP